MIDAPASEPGPRAKRRGWRDGWRTRVTGGEASGTSRARRISLVRAYLAVAAFLALLDSGNVLTILHDAARRGQTLAIWEPIIWESTSGLAELAVCGVIYFALRRAPPGRGAWFRTILTHAGASVVFSALHLGAMALMRTAIAALLGQRYHLALTDLPYEYRKDLVAYLVLAGIFWVFARPTLESETVEAPEESRSRTFDIAVGNRTIRPLVSDILLLRGAGNYVEFLLTDGRRPLMRTSMREMEIALAPCGFIRTHRSWMVNGRHVRGLQPAGSGDFQIEIEGGVAAPLSRRFPKALARLRAGEGALPQ